MKDGTVLVAGGYDVGPNPVNSAELYDPATQAWTPTAHLKSARVTHTATLLHDGQVLVAGGSNSVEIYDPYGEPFWFNTASLSTPRGLHTATLLGTKRLMPDPYVNLVLTLRGAG